MLQPQISLLKTQLRHQPAAGLVSELVMERVPAAFGDNWQLYRDWRSQLSEKLDVDACDIILTGSAAVGFSLNPLNKLAAFSDESDIDVAIISQFHFDTAWRILREKRSSQVNSSDWQYIQEHKNYYIFEGCIALDRLLHLMPFAKTWKSALTFMGTQSPTQDRDIKCRLYRDNYSVRFYQKSGIEKLKIALNKGQI